MIEEMTDLIPSGSIQSYIGKASVPSSLLMAAWNYISIKDIADWAVAGTAILGFVYLGLRIWKFLFVDIRGAKLDNEIKEQKLKDGEDSK